MLSGILQQPYVFALLVALGTAVLTYLYGRVTDKDPAAPARTFNKTLAAGVLVGAALTYLATPRAADSPLMVATEPFDTAGAAVGGVVPTGF